VKLSSAEVKVRGQVKKQGDSHWLTYECDSLTLGFSVKEISQV